MKINVDQNSREHRVCSDPYSEVFGNAIGGTEVLAGPGCPHSLQNQFRLLLS